jgi:hypothetical protein
MLAGDVGVGERDVVAMANKRLLAAVTRLSCRLHQYCWLWASARYEKATGRKVSGKGKEKER